MTNLERWRHFTKHLFTPDSLVDFAWYFTVNAALQRRVWYGNLEAWSLFPNLYLVFVTPPGKGKGMILNPVESLITHYKLDMQDKIVNGAESASTIASLKGVPRYLFPIGPDDLTYQRLTQRMSENIRHLRYKAGEKTKIYTHSSTVFMLDELSSLLKKNETLIPKLLLQTYDCMDYEYDTKHNERDMIKNSCLSMLACCVPDFIPDAYKHGMFTDGFVSRCIFLFEKESRFDTFFLNDVEEDQLAAKRDLLNWVLQLSKLFGQLKFSDSTKAVVEKMYQDSEPRRKTAGAKMQHYYSRLRAHVMKLAVAIHFSESMELFIPTQCFEQAFELLRAAEPKMKICFGLGGRNELAPIVNEVYHYVKNAGEDAAVSEAELFREFMDQATMGELTEVLMQLQAMSRVIKTQEGYRVVE